jgi:hypothetical protein
MKAYSIFFLMLIIFSPSQFKSQIYNRTVQTIWRRSQSHSKPNFIRIFFLIIPLFTSSLNTAQTNEIINIDRKAEGPNIKTTELQGILNSAVRNAECDYSQQDTLTNIMFTGQATGDEFGFSVSTAGDVNGDGYSDIIIGAWKNDAGGTLAGKAYIYFGGTTMDNVPDVTLTGETHYSQFGNSVNTAGDVNGDGYGDVIVGAYNICRAYIYFGGSAMDNIPDVTMYGEAAGDEFGCSVSTAGDINRDGYSDVIIGADWNDAGGTWAGRAYVYFGGISMDNSADVVMTGEAVDDMLGVSVSTAGDVNGDGYSDVIIGAYNALGNFKGRSYIYFGGRSMDNIADVTMNGEATNNQFGVSVSTAGDVNGDGYGDVIVGARLNSAGGMFAGRSYIYFGDRLMDNIADVTMTGEAAFDYFGRSVSTAGDVNKDGYCDVLVGAYGNDAGRAHIYLIYQSVNYVDVDIIINNYSLKQNYPNPFNPSTKIRFTISPARTELYAGGDLRFTILKVYDVLGNEVATLVNEEKPAGNYEVEFSINNLQLTSGVYFYRLKAGEYLETKKMILLK